MEDDMQLAETLLRTMLDFLERGSVDNLVEGEVINYFRICKQIEIYYEKFKVKGFFISMDVTTGVFSLSRSETNRSKYDLSKLADKLFTMFCKPSTKPALLNKALYVFLKDFGKPRVGRCISEIAGLKQVFCLETIIKRASEHVYDLEATLLMESYQCLSSAPRGMNRVKDLLMELVVDDECAPTVVAMFAVEDEFNSPQFLEIKRLLLSRLTENFERLPHSRLWLKMVTSLGVVDSINAYEPFLEFILKLVKHLSNDITCVDSEKKLFYSPPGSIKYDHLVYVITKFYRNKKSCQKIINFIFNQCGLNAAVWYSILDSCHNMPTDVRPPLPYYDYSTPDSISKSRLLEWKK